MNTLTELKDALDDVSRQRPPLPNVAAIAQERRGGGRQVRVLALVVSTVVGVAGLLGVVVMLELSPGKEPASPIDSAPPTTELPTYQHGYKLMKSASGTDPSGEVLTFVVPQEPMLLARTCAGPAIAPRQETLIDREIFGSGTCDTTAKYDAGLVGLSFAGLQSSEYWPLTPGESVTVTQQWANGQSYEGSRWAIGIYVKVPVSEYEFQGSPEEIAAVPADRFTGACATILQSSSSNRTFSCQLTLRADQLQWFTWSSAPGKLRITANGQETVGPRTWWDYGRAPEHVEVDLRDFDAKPGDAVTVTAEWTPYTNDESELGIVFYDETNPPGSR